MSENKNLDHKGRKRVVVTGMGIIAPNGNNVDSFWKALCEGKNAYSEISYFDPAAYKLKTNIACEVNNFRIEDYCDAGRVDKISKLGRASQFAVAALTMAMKDAGLKDFSAYYEPENVGLFMGTTNGEIQVQHDFVKASMGEKKADPALFQNYLIHGIAGNVADHFNIQGPTHVIPTACASGLYAISEGCSYIKNNGYDMMVVGATDAFDSIVFAGFSRLFSVAPELCQPFDKNRKGIMVGEGSAFLILESLESALKRNADIHAEVIGNGFSTDAFHMTNPKPDADERYKAGANALIDAGHSANDIDCIIAHGTGTTANDKAETKMVHKLLGDYTKKVPVTSIKSMIGHTMGAATTMSAVAACKMMADGCITPTANYETKDPDCDIDVVHGEPRKKEVNTVMINGFAFGGNNAVSVFKKYMV